jgi:hypothetical protein
MIAKRVIARIRWRTGEEGGRRSVPRGTKYVTVASFDPPTPNWPDEAWSVIVEPFQTSDLSQTAEVVLSFLMGEKGPENILKKSVKFQLLEGKHVVANGEIIDDVA